MMFRWQWMHPAALAAICLAGGGCGRSSGPARVAVAGQVDRAGIPVAEGTISFLPIGPEGGPAAMTSVADGKYRFERRLGPPPGKHRVLVVPSSSAKRERFARPAANAKSSSGDGAAAAPVRWETEVEVPDAQACELPIHLK